MNEKRISISELKKELSELHNEKELLFSEKEKCNIQVTEAKSGVISNYSTIKLLNEKINSANSQREKARTLFSKQLAEIKSLKSSTPSEDPFKLKEKIEQLEFHLETEILSFEREKGEMKKLKELKKKYEGAAKASSDWKRVKEISESLDKLKDEERECTKNIRTHAKERKKLQTETREKKKQIDGFIKSKNEAFDKFLECKKKYKEVNDKLKSLQSEVGEINESVKKVANSKKEQQMRDMTMDVENKIKQRKKLTTEDLLAFQGRTD